jgi:hypothetical protein
MRAMLSNGPSMALLVGMESSLHGCPHSCWKYPGIMWVHVKIEDPPKGADLMLKQYLALPVYQEKSEIFL